METERRETGTLIGSDKVEGTAVYGADNQKIGSIERVRVEITNQATRPSPSATWQSGRDNTDRCGAASELHSL
jgi:hypothetical protein